MNKAMDEAAECFVSGCMAKVLRLSRVVGVAPISFVKKNTGWRIRLSRGWSFFGYCLVTATILFMMTALIDDLFLEEKHSYYLQNQTVKVVWLTELFVTTVIAGITVFGAPGSMRSMIACLNHVQKINIELNIRQWPGSKEIERKKVLLFFSIAIVNAILRCVDIEIYLNRNNTQNDIFLLYMFYHFGTWITQMQLMLIVVIIQHVMYSFKAINVSLKLMLNESALLKVKSDDENMLSLLVPFEIATNNKNKQICYSEANTNAISEITQTVSGRNKPLSYHEKIKSLTQVYVSTCDVVREVDRCHGLVVLMMLASYLFYLVITPYYLIHALVDIHTSQNMLIEFTKGALELMWCIVHLVNLIILIEPCHLTHMEMETTRELVSRLMFCTHSVYDPLAVQLEQFSRHLMLNQTFYSPMKVITLQRSLVATILGSITTYLVIIVEL